MNFSPEDAFELCLERARSLMGSEKYNSWLSNASFRGFANGVFTIGLDSQIRVNFVSLNYKDKLEELLREISGDPSVTAEFTHLPETLSLGGFPPLPGTISFPTFFGPDMYLKGSLRVPTISLPTPRHVPLPMRWVIPQPIPFSFMAVWAWERPTWFRP